MSVVGIVPAAGRGERLGAGSPKAFVVCGGRPLIEWSLEVLRDTCDRVVVAVPPGEEQGPDQVAGGAVRSESVRAALAAAPEATVAVVQDAARPLLTRDLVERCVAAVVAQGAVFYTVLTYNGTETWHPPHPADEAIRAAFHAHQGGDKGFGPAAGPLATEALAQAFLKAGYRVRSADSPWRLGPADRALIRELAEGTARAVRETGRVPEAEITSWRDARLAGATCVVGHTDLLAFPG